MVKKLRIIFFLILTGFFILFIFTLLNLASGKSEAPFTFKLPSPIINNQPEAVLYFTPASDGEVLTVEIGAQTELTILGADLEINFDPALLERKDIKPGSLFASPLIIKKEVNGKTGRIFFALGTLEPNSLKNGSLARLEFLIKTPQTQETILNFGSLTDLAVKEKGRIELELKNYQLQINP